MAPEIHMPASLAQMSIYDDPRRDLTPEERTHLEGYLYLIGATRGLLGDPSYEEFFKDKAEQYVKDLAEVRAIMRLSILRGEFSQWPKGSSAS